MRPVDDVLKDAEAEIKALESKIATTHPTMALLRQAFVPASRSYFSLAALTRRANLEEHHRKKGLSQLFKMRSLLETKLIESFLASSNLLPLMSEATKDAFFGKSKKQGVSIRYALASCVPTARCGGLCYAHDGRDRELLHIFRGALNYFLGLQYENANATHRAEILRMLSKSIDHGVEAAIDDQADAASLGYNRMPRIRFSHVGEMAATPNFANDVAREVKKRDQNVQCVVYTRHPKAALLNLDLFVVNFTLEGTADVRSKYIPKGARVVNSSWDGLVNENAEVNFLEHHVEKSSASKGNGSICPVTANHKNTPSCDSAGCQKCFVPASHP
jgi:hypothetical protein